MTKKTNSPFMAQFLKPKKIPQKTIRPVSYYIEPEEVSSKICYSIQNPDQYLSHLESLDLFQEENENPDFYLDSKSILSHKKQGQTIYRFMKKYEKSKFDLKYQNDQLLLILEHKPVGMIEKAKSTDLFFLYTNQQFDSLSVIVYGGETKCLQEDGTFKRQNLNHKHYKIDLILSKQESAEEKQQRIEESKKERIDKYKEQQLAYIDLCKQAEKDINNTVSKKDWKVVSGILIFFIIAIFAYICLSSINQILF